MARHPCGFEWLPVHLGCVNIRVASALLSTSSKMGAFRSSFFSRPITVCYLSVQSSQLSQMNCAVSLNCCVPEDPTATCVSLPWGGLSRTWLGQAAPSLLTVVHSPMQPSNLPSRVLRPAGRSGGQLTDPVVHTLTGVVLFWAPVSPFSQLLLSALFNLTFPFAFTLACLCLPPHLTAITATTTRLAGVPAPDVAHVVLAFLLLAFLSNFLFLSLCSVRRRPSDHLSFWLSCFRSFVPTARAALSHQSFMQLLETLVLIGEHNSLLQALGHQPEHVNSLTTR